jgi:hypothetical protein
VFDPVWLGAALVAGVAAMLMAASVWARVFRQAGGAVATSEAVAAWLGSNLGRYLPGKVWQLTWIAAYMRARGSSGAAGFAASLALQAVALATGAGVSAALIGRTAFDDLGLWGLAAAAVVVAGALHPAVLRGVIRVGARLLGEPRPEGELTGRDLAVAAVGALLVWALYGVGFWLLTRGVGSSPPVGPLDATAIFAGGYVLGYVVLIAPGGLVVREGAIAALLGTVGGVPLGVAAGVAVLARVWTTLAELVAFGLAAVIGLRAAPKRR